MLVRVYMAERNLSHFSKTIFIKSANRSILKRNGAFLYIKGTFRQSGNIPADMMNC